MSRVISVVVAGVLYPSWALRHWVGIFSDLVPTPLTSMVPERWSFQANSLSRPQRQVVICQVVISGMFLALACLLSVHAVICVMLTPARAQGS